MPPFLHRTLKAFAAPFSPPFPGLWAIMAAYFVVSFVAYPHSQVLLGNFPDPDDYMYLDQLIDWMNGQSWYDNIQHRLNPPDGVVIHFSRIAMLPMAALIWLFERFGLAIKDASTLMAMIYPPLLLCGFFWTMKRVAAMFMTKDWTGVTAYIALFSTGLMYLFMPGHVDHHGLMVMIVAGAMGCAVKAMQEPEDCRWGPLAGMILAIGLMLALEILPWVLVISGYLGLWAVIKGGKPARQTFGFAMSLLTVSVLCLLVTRPPSDFLIEDVLTYSVVYVLLTAGIAICFAGVALTAKGPFLLRGGTAVFLAAVTGFLFLHRFPDLIAGPYGAMDPALVDLILQEASEATPMLQKDYSPAYLLTHLAASAVALVAALYFLWRAKEAGRWSWGFLVAMLAMAMPLTMFYQSRFNGTMGMLGIIPLSAALQLGWQWLQEHMKQNGKLLAEAALLIALGPLFPVLVPSIHNGRSIYPDTALFLGTMMEDEPCDAHKLGNVLAVEALPKDHMPVMMNYLWLGPEILYRTPYAVLAAPYHMDVSGNLDSYLFYSTIDPGEAQYIARKHNVDVVLACSAFPDAYLHPRKSQQGVAHEFGTPFIEFLLNETPPDWLREIAASTIANYDIYLVQPPAPDEPLMSYPAGER